MVKKIITKKDINMEESDSESEENVNKKSNEDIEESNSESEEEIKLEKPKRKVNYVMTEARKIAFEKARKVRSKKIALSKVEKEKKKKNIMIIKIV